MFTPIITAAMANDKTIIDLDALEDPVFFIKLDGKEHPLEQLSVEGFIANTRLMQELDVNAGTVGEIDLMVTMLARSFPSIGAERFRKIPMSKLYALLDKVRLANGSKAESEDANPPQAAADASGT